MKYVTLLRHAKSSWDDAQVGDLDRPLSGRGLRDAPRMGRRLAENGLEPDLMLLSPSLRTRETADFVERAIAPNPLRRRIENDLYLATPGEILSLLAGLEDSVDDVLVIGHNPGLTQLANMMLPELDLENLPTAGVVAVACDTANWKTIDQAAFRLRFFDTPKLARG